MKDQLLNIKKALLCELEANENNEAFDIAALEALKVKYLGKKGELTAILRTMGKLSPEERPIIGQLANEVRSEIEAAIEEKKVILGSKEKERKLKAEHLDISAPATVPSFGGRHPISIVREQMENIFLGMGFEIAEGPEIEREYYNFTALNTPDDHPARDPQDTFYITPDILLRTQTSPVQIRSMTGKEPPIRIISPGRVYRCDEVDATHSPMFHQLEGLVVDKGITMGDLKGTLDLFAKTMFGEKTETRFRPHHFPFTEPSAEVDVSCFVCGGKGCRLCKGEGWIEILGAGMVHPNVLKNCGIDPEVYSGFAFGMGIERIVMTKFAISDLRFLYENDLRLLSQFN